MSLEPGGLTALAPAKINLALEIVGRRDDGYHEIDTVMTTLDLADRVSVRPGEPGSGLRVQLRGEHRPAVAAGDELAFRAADALAREAGREADLSIEVEKRIPPAAGLGGGSSDAAATLRALNQLWELHWPTERLAGLAAGLGSDVPFFLYGGAARCTGRGERVAPLPDLRPLRLLVLVPPVPPPADKTARRYAALHPHDFTDGGRSERLARRLARRAPPPTADLVNAFEAVVERSEPELVAHYAAYAAAAHGAVRFHLCGAGPALFLFVHEMAKIAELRRDFSGAGANVLEARTLRRADALRLSRSDGTD